MSEIMRDFPLPSLSNGDFLNELGSFMKSSKGASPIHLTQKRLSPKGSKNELSSNVVNHPPQFETNTQKYHVLIRAKYGSDKSLSTAVAPEDLTEFWSKYSQVLKSGFVGLQKSKNKAKK